MIWVGIAASALFTAVALLWYWRSLRSTPATIPLNGEIATQQQEVDENLDLFLHHLGAVTRIALSPNAEYIAVGTKTWRPRDKPGEAAGIWSRRTRRQVAQLPIEDEVTTMSFSPDGSLFAIS